jgi:hypothetical protein
VNNVIMGSRKSSAENASGGQLTDEGELWVLSKQRVNRFEGGFKDYKNLILKKVMSGQPIE